MRKPICLITGATDGVGRATATELASKGFTVVLAARNAPKAAAVKTEIEAATGGEVDIILVDLASLRSVRDLAETFKGRYSRLDVLINNAGIFMPRRELTGDGFEACYQVNYLSHFLLTHFLLAHLRASEQGRVINLSSSVYTSGRFDAQNLQSEKRFSVMGAYAASKLFMLLFSLELAERLKGTRVTANAVHPGVVRTQMMRRAPGLFRIIAYLALPFAISPQEGAATSVFLASSPELATVSGRYFTSGKSTAITTQFNTETIRRHLWEKSEEGLQRYKTVGRVEIAMPQTERYHPLLVSLHWVVAASSIAALLFGSVRLVPIPNSDPHKISGLHSREWARSSQGAR